MNSYLKWAIKHVHIDWVSIASVRLDINIALSVVGDHFSVSIRIKCPLFCILAISFVYLHCDSVGPAVCQFSTNYLDFSVGNRWYKIVSICIRPRRHCLMLNNIIIIIEASGWAFVAPCIAPHAFHYILPIKLNKYSNMHITRNKII